VVVELKHSSDVGVSLLVKLKQLPKQMPLKLGADLKTQNPFIGTAAQGRIDRDTVS
jgi:hypothetical protein